MKTVCELDMCAGCMACLEICGKDAITIRPGLKAYNAEIDPARCVECGLCHRICQKNHPPQAVPPISWKQGWSTDPDQRAESSSGGLAAELARAFIRSGGSVCSCVFRDGAFGFEFAETEQEVSKFVGSKYTKSDPSGIYREIARRLSAGEQVLFIGLPCQAAALCNFVGEKRKKNLTTVDLICHGTPSRMLLEQYFRDRGQALNDISSLAFRGPKGFCLHTQGEAVDRADQDSYIVAFLNAMCYTENCYHCDYAKMERVTDLTIGDSWGTELQDEFPKGVSLVLCMSQKGEKLLSLTQAQLYPVDLENAVAHNMQLRQPSTRNRNRDRFLDAVARGSSLDRAIWRGLPKWAVKKEAKKLLVATGFRKSR